MSAHWGCNVDGFIAAFGIERSLVKNENAYGILDQGVGTVAFHGLS